MREPPRSAPVLGWLAGRLLVDLDVSVGFYFLLCVRVLITYLFSYSKPQRISFRQPAPCFFCLPFPVGPLISPSPASSPGRILPRRPSSQVFFSVAKSAAWLSALGQLERAKNVPPSEPPLAGWELATTCPSRHPVRPAL